MPRRGAPDGTDLAFKILTNSNSLVAARVLKLIAKAIETGSRLDLNSYENPNTMCLMLTAYASAERGCANLART